MARLAVSIKKKPATVIIRYMLSGSLRIKL